MDELEVKIAKLPQWARDHIKFLRTRNEPVADEIRELRNKIEHLSKKARQQQDRIDAMVAMFQCAAKGGNEVAAAVQRIVEDYLVTDGE